MLKNVNFDAPIVCVVPTAAFPDSSVVMTVNGRDEPVSGGYDNVRGKNLVFELPAGTRKLNVTTKSTENSLFAVRGIMIYQ
ncbi:hypothetical protein SDC9_210852 [bioreactor metagenome]|uniref:Uncharacterized protein n=1 Tax=bioreactor metagenome TaxID=1076179 RepID=A0A645JHC8_9ZZZZ